MCARAGQPSSKTGRLSFCPYDGKVCCSKAQDVQLQKQFEAMNISDSFCASAVKSIICAVSILLKLYYSFLLEDKEHKLPLASVINDKC